MQVEEGSMTKEELLKAKNDLAQTIGHLDKFQMERVDAVVTAELNSAKDEVQYSSISWE